MKIHAVISCRFLVAVILGFRGVTQAQLPADFPAYRVVDNGGAAPGSWLGNLGGLTSEGTKNYNVVLDNSGSNTLFLSKTQAVSRFVMPNGLIAQADSAKNAFRFLNETFTELDSYSVAEGYTLDSHDVKLLPNGHALLMAKETRAVDMSQLVAGGRPDASVTGNIIQELDGNKRVVFEWHTFDHIDITNSFYDLTQKSIDYAHINSVAVDPKDNNFLISLRTTSEIVKINRQTGEVMWHLGGKMNSFTFIGEHEENAPYYTVGQHDVHRLANGNVLFFDNGNISGGGITPNDRNYSRAVEYEIDEANLVATLVWEYRHSPDISAPCTGAVKRFENGNTLIDWGCAVPVSGTVVSEVSALGEVVFEISYPRAGASATLTKEVWNSPTRTLSATNHGMSAGSAWEANEARASLALQSFQGSAENEFILRRHLDAPRLPQFVGPAPVVMAERVSLEARGVESFTAELGFELPGNEFSFDTPLFTEPNDLVVYHRPTTGQGRFEPLTTAYDTASRTLYVSASEPGEFIFGYSVAAIPPLSPSISQPADHESVNQQQPITLDWIPAGLIESCDLQVGLDSNFAELALSTNVSASSYLLTNLLPGTNYFWRVRSINSAGTSEWASASFATVPPVLQVIYPAGGEVWQRFQVVTIKWVDNLSGNVAVDLYKGGVSNRTFSANTPSTGSFTWTVGQFQAIPPGADYAIKIRSVSDASFYCMSQPFTIINPPRLDTNAILRLPDGRLQFDVSVPGALQASILGSTNLASWEVLEQLQLTNGTARFIDAGSAGLPQRFYRLSVP